MRLLLPLLLVACTGKNAANPTGTTVPIPSPGSTTGLPGGTPSGTYTMSELIQIGGIRPLMKRLLDAGLLHGDCLTVNGKTMAENSIQIASVRTRCLDVDLYNDRVNKVKNKSRVLFTELCSLITQALNQDMTDSGPMQVVVDRQ